MQATTINKNNENDDDPFACFGSDDDDDDSSNNDNCKGAAPKRQQQQDNTKEQHHHQEVARRLMENAKIRQMATHRLPVTSPHYEVFQTTTNGQGLRAKKSFACGDVILKEHAIMRVPNQQAASSREQAEALHLRAVMEQFKVLSQPSQQAVLELCNNTNTNNPSKKRPVGIGEENDFTTSQESQVLGIYETNGYQLGGGGGWRQDVNFENSPRENQGGLFLTASRINHSCRPNANHIWRHDLQSIVYIATRRIDIGEEICTTYGPPDECLDTAGRRLYLRNKFRFDCGCDMCLEGNQRGGDDRMKELSQRRSEISILLATAAEASTTTSTDNAEQQPLVKEILASVDTCLQLLKELGLGTESGAFLKPLLHSGYQAALLPQESSSQEGDDCSSQRLARSYLCRELTATENSEGVGSPKALELQLMIDAISA